MLEDKTPKTGNANLTRWYYKIICRDGSSGFWVIEETSMREFYLWAQFDKFAKHEETISIRKKSYNRIMRHLLSAENLSIELIKTETFEESGLN